MCSVQQLCTWRRPTSSSQNVQCPVNVWMRRQTVINRAWGRMQEEERKSQKRREREVCIKVRNEWKKLNEKCISGPAHVDHRSSIRDSGKIHIIEWKIGGFGWEKTEGVIEVEEGQMGEKPQNQWKKHRVFKSKMQILTEGLARSMKFGFCIIVQNLPIPRPSTQSQHFHFDPFAKAIRL